jgi:hypothetical protein
MQGRIFSIILAFCVMLPLSGVAQRTLSILPVYHSKILSLDSVFTNSKGDAIRIETCKFYISNAMLTESLSMKGTHLNDYFLIDAFEPRTWLLGTIDTATYYTELSFNLGVDSVTSNSGALDGPLDPSMGMYWTWQSGYINAKLEGSSTASTARNNQFQYHLGGYVSPFNALQKVNFNLTNKADIILLWDIAPFFEQVDILNNNHTMSPSANAVELSKLLASLFSVQ